MIKSGRMNESISLEDIQNAKYASSFMQDRADITIDGRTYAKIGKNKWEYIPTNPHAFGGTYTDKQIYDRVRDSQKCSLNESAKFNASTPSSKVAAEVRRLVDKAKKSNDNKDAWAVVDFLYDFPNALCESSVPSPVNESVYYVSGSTPTGEGDASITNTGKITDPAKAIEQWFKIGAKHRTGTAITTTKKSDAITLVTWADKNQDKITEWHKKYGCPYKLDFLLKAISDQVRRKCSSFYESEYGDMVYPFDVG